MSYPAIRPSLLLDFGNSRRLDPRITFTRASSATFYDGSTTAKAEENLLLQSQDYSASWTVTSLTPVTGKVAPNSTSTATEFTASAGNAVLTQGHFAIAGSYTFSVWLRRVTGTGNIQIAADTGTWTTRAITGTWARYEVTQTLVAGSRTAGVRVVTSGDAIEVWGAQLEQRASMTDYIATTTQAITNYVPALQTAAAGVARFDHNPVTRESLGLLVEEQRANLFTYSEQFDDATWTKVASTITANTLVAPDGTLTGDKLVEDTSNASHNVNKGSITTSTTTASTCSFYAKAGGRSVIQVRYGVQSVVNRGQGNVDLTTGTVALIQNVGTATGTTLTATPVGNGWYRIAISTNPNDAASTQMRLFVILGNVAVGSMTGAAYTGDGYSGIYIWGAQLEAGGFATSYIPTAGSSVTRNADVASMTGTNFSSWYNQSEGTLYAECSFSGISTAANKIVNFDNGAGFANSIDVYAPNVTPRFDVYVSSAAQATLTPAPGTPVPLNTNVKTSGAYATNNFAVSRNGGAVSTDSLGNVPTVSRACIGNNNLSTQFLNGTIRSIRYYPQRLPDAQLVALTG
jgi:hypothetical protein